MASLVVYQYIERPGIESTKIDIDEANESDITGGYFIEKDIAMKVDFARDMWFGCPYWANQTQDYFVLKQPEPASSELTARMLEYLEEHMKSVHNAVSPNAISKSHIAVMYSLSS